MLPGYCIAMGVREFTFTPPDFGSDLILWLDANEGVYNDAGTTLATDGQTVQEWHDQSGNGNNVTQSTSSQRPTFRSSGLNSLPSIEFVFADTEFLEHTSFDFGDIAPLSVFFVTRMDTETNNGRLWGFRGEGSSTDWNDAGSVAFNRVGTNDTIEVFRAGTQRLNASFSPNTNYRVGFIFDGTDSALYLDGVTVDTDTGYSPAFNGPGLLRIGCSHSTDSWDGYICEVVAVKRALDAQERADLNTYFANKWL